MSANLDRNYDHGSQSDDNYQFERYRIEPIYDALVCHLTKQIMQDPVTIENGETFEREAIEKWFKNCKDSGKRLVCPRTEKELKSADMNPSIALRKMIEEWSARNEAALVDIAQRSFTLENAESEIIRGLSFVQYICQNSLQNKHIVRKVGLLPRIMDMLRSSSCPIRCKALETLRISAEEDVDIKEIMAEGNIVRTIVKFLSHEPSKDREEAISLLYELSKSELLSEKIGSINGAIIILMAISSSRAENDFTVETAEKTLLNLESSENNVRQMAEYGRLQPLLSQLLDGSLETKLSMASYLGGLPLTNEVKLFVAKSVGSSLISLFKSGNIQLTEASLRALNQIACETSAEVLINLGILPPLVRGLLIVGANQLPMRLKEVAATILANVMTSGINFDSIPIGHDGETLLSEEIIHSLLQLISNTGPTIECKLLQVLVGLTSSRSAVLSIVSAIRSASATISLIQFIEAPQTDLRSVSIKLLHNISPHMGNELADCLCGAAGQLGGLINIVTENIGITEEQADAAGLLAELPERDLNLTRQMLDGGAFQQIISRLYQVYQGEARGIRFMAPYIEGLVRILARITFILSEEPNSVEFCQQNNIAAFFVDLLQFNRCDRVQMFSALALENLSQESNNLTSIPELPPPGFCGLIFPCFYKKPLILGLCRLHHGICSSKDTFCLVEGQTVEKLVALLDHTNVEVVEAALAALCTLLEDSVNIEQGVSILCEADGIRSIINILLNHRTDNLMKRSIWAMERILRSDDMAIEVSRDRTVSTVLVDAFQHGDYTTKQVAEKALRHIDKIPTFSGIFTDRG